MAMNAGSARGFWCLSRGMRALLPLPGSAYRFRRAVGFFALGILFGAASGPTHAQAPIRIGASLGLTGTYAEFGQTIQRGYQLCVKHANAKGGVLGRKLELTIQDDQSQIPAAVAIYERLVTQDKIDLVFSPYSSPITDAVAAVTDKHGKPMVAWGAATTSLFKKGRRFLVMLRTVLVLFSCAALLFALNSRTTMYEMVQNAYKVTLVGALVPLAAGIFWKRASVQGALLSIFSGLVVWLGCETDFADALVPPQINGLIAALIGMVVGSLAPQIVPDHRGNPSPTA